MSCIIFKIVKFQRIDLKMEHFYPSIFRKIGHFIRGEKCEQREFYQFMVLWFLSISRLFCDVAVYFVVLVSIQSTIRR